MTFTPLTPTYNVEELYAKCSSAITDEVTDPIVASVINVLLHTNVLSAEDLAAQLSVSPRKLSGAVELLTGLPLGKFIAEWRFLQSQELLRTTELSYTDVAHRCGYNDEWSLILIYEKRLKTTPHIFRTGYRIINSNYAINRHGTNQKLNGQIPNAKNKVFSKN